jgi:hypothetical protein
VAVLHKAADEIINSSELKKNEFVVASGVRVAQSSV